MIYHELNWLRMRSQLLCPELRKLVLTHYRPQRWLPGYFQSPIRKLKHRFIKIPVIIQTKLNLNPKDHNEIVSRCENLFEGVDRLPLIGAIATKIHLNDLAFLTQEAWVEKIWLDRPVHTVLDVAASAAGVNRVWEWGFTGEKVTVAVLDTGVYPHPDLVEPENRIIAFRDFVHHKSQPYDDNGHGTHVAGDIAGNGLKSKGQYRGPAPRASIIGLKVLNKAGIGLTSQVIAGIQWCVANQTKYQIRIINMSLGASPYGSYQEDLLAIAAAKAWQAGMVVCVAAGNLGPEAGTICSPGILPEVITVGAMDNFSSKSRQEHRIAEFSSRGPTSDRIIKPDILAPGTNIISLRAARSMLDKQMKDQRAGNWYFSMSGTSMASAFCAGVIANLIQLHPDYSPDQIKRLLLTTAEDMGLAPTEQGKGYLDAYKAVLSLQTP